MIVSSQMDLDQLAEYMGECADRGDAREMRELLVRTFPGLDIGEIDDSEWIDLLKRAVNRAASPETRS